MSKLFDNISIKFSDQLKNETTEHMGECDCSGDCFDCPGGSSLYTKDQFLFFKLDNGIANEKSLLELNEVIEKHPDDLSLLYQRVILFELLKQYPKALKDCNRALELQSSWDMQFLLKRAELFRKLKDFSNALLDYTQVLLKNPKNVLALLGRADIYWQIKQYTSALIDIENILDQDEGFVPAIEKKRELLKIIEFNTFNLTI